MTELLKRWAELEPQRCRPKPVGDPAPGPHIVAAGTWWSAGAFPDISPALVLVAVIEAIEARGWTCSLTHNLVQPGTWRAIVWASTAPLPGTRTYRPSRASDANPAAALLGAYLAALEAEGGQ